MKKGLFIYALLLVLVSGSLNAQVENMRELFEAISNKYNLPITEEDKEKISGTWKVEGVNLSAIKIDDNEPITEDVPLSSEFNLKVSGDKLIWSTNGNTSIYNKIGDNSYETVVDTTLIIRGVEGTTTGKYKIFLWKDALGNYAMMGDDESLSKSGKKETATTVLVTAKYFYKLPLNAKAEYMRELFEALSNKYNVPITEQDKVVLSKKWNSEGVSLGTITVDQEEPTTEDKRWNDGFDIKFTSDTLIFKEKGGENILVQQGDNRYVFEYNTTTSEGKITTVTNLTMIAIFYKNTSGNYALNLETTVLSKSTHARKSKANTESVISLNIFTKLLE